MENWKTHLILHFGTDNIKKPSEVAKKLEEIGFETSLGPVDFIYKWDKEPTKEQVLELADKVSEKLQGTGSVFNLDTHD